uniref:TonB-dependent siderophore receptor n=1 Tax=unclassified Variovorax TaxID=663243 RepID=UPI000D3F664D
MHRALTDRRLRPSLLAMALALWGAAPALHAQAPERAATVERGYDIGPQSLGATLTRIATEGGQPISIDADLVRGLAAPAVRGSFTPEQAAQRALAGSGLQLVRTGNGALTVQRGPAAPAAAPAHEAAPGPHTLPEVRVTDSVDASGATEGTGLYTAATSNVGGKSAQSLREVPQSVSVVTRQQIEDLGMSTMTDALKATPGIANFQGSLLADRALSRGFEMGTDNMRVDGGAALYKGFGSDFDLSFYDHVEVLRGADGLFGGNGEPGGVVNLVRKKPTREKQLVVQGQLGSWNFRRTDLDVSGPLSEDGRVRGRAVLAQENKNFFVDVADSRRTMAYGILEADLTPATTVSLGASYIHRDASYQGYGLPRASTGEDLRLPRSTYLSGAQDRADKEISSVFGHVKHSLGAGWTLDIDANHERAGQDRFDHYFNNSVNPFTGAGTFGGANQQSETWRNSSLDASLKGRFGLWGRQHDVLLGGSWARFEADAVQARPSPYVTRQVPNIFLFDPHAYLRPASLLPTNTNIGRTQNTGLYGSLRLHLSDPLRVIVGGRLGQYKYGYQTILYNTAGAITGTTNTLYKDSDVFTPYLGATYDLNDTWTAYGSIAETFKSQANFRAGPAPGEPLAPVSGRNHELGLKGEHMGGRLHSAFAVYRIERNGAAVRDTAFARSSGDLGSSCCYLPSGRIVSKGFDAELAGELARGLQVSLSYSYNANRDKNAPAAGRYEGRTPEHMVKMFAAYRLPGQFGRWKLGGGATVQSKTYLTDYAYLRNANGTVGNQTTTFRIRQGGYAVWSAFAEYQIDDHWTASLNINNLFDKTYYSSIGYLDYGSFYGAPRNLMFTLRGKF